MNIYKPHSITFPGPVSVYQISNWTPTPGFSTFEEYASSGVAPIFVGTHSRTPMVDFETVDVEAILGLLDTTYKLGAGFTAAVSLAYLAKANLGFNGAVDSGANLRINMARSQLSLEGISAQQNASASFSLKLKGIDAADGSGCLSVSSTAADLGTPAAVNQYTLGPVAVNGSTICATGVQVNNNIVHDTQYCSGGPDPEYTAIDRFAPTVTIATNEVDEVLSHFVTPNALSAFSFYLRRKTAGALNVANATTSHIKFTATVGSAHASGEKEITVRLAQSLAVATGQAIT